VRVVASRRSAEPVPAENDRRVPLPWPLAVLPLVTLGFGSAAPFFYAGMRSGRRRLTAIAVGYLALVVAWFGYMTGGREDAWHAMTGIGALLALGCLATAHSFAVRRPSGWAAAFRAIRGLDPVAAGRARVDRRRRARRIVRDDPELAEELRIGRPDLRRTFDDGGLVDVNHVPASTLAALPGITPAQAAEIVAARERIGGFDAVDDLGVLLDVAPATLDRLGDVLICRP
jgi:hypothetical protein